MIKYYNYGSGIPLNKVAVMNNGTIQHGAFVWMGGVKPELICDTHEEAQRMRLLIEQRREELEAVERKYELLIAAEVSQ